MATLELTMEDLRAVAGFAAACAEPVQSLFTRVCPDDPRPRAALDAALAFADGAPRSALQRTTATDAHRAARELRTEPTELETPSHGADPGLAREAAAHAAEAAGDAAAAAYLHPLAKATQVRHLLGAAAHAARAAELARGDDPVVAEYVLVAAATRAKKATPTLPSVRDVLERYPRAPMGRNRVAAFMHRLDGLIRDPAPEPRAVEDAGPFFHGTRADLQPGDLLTPGWGTNYGSGKTARHIYLTASDFGAPLAAALARGEGPPRVYRVEPLGPIHDDPNVTDKKFPGNPTRSYRTTEPLRVIEEVRGCEFPAQEVVDRMRANAAELKALGIEAMD